MLERVVPKKNAPTLLVGISTGTAIMKGSKSDTERQISYDITFMWNLKKMGYK